MPQNSNADLSVSGATHPDTANEVLIRIATPLPMDVAGTLLRAIGTVYPSAALVSDKHAPPLSGFGAPSAMTIRVDPSDRYDGPLDIEADRADGEIPVDFTGFHVDEDQKAWVRTAPAEELCVYLGGIAHRIFTATEGATNFVEWTINTTDHSAAYLLSVSRQPVGLEATSPSNLLAKAKARIAELEAEVAALRASDKPT